MKKPADSVVLASANLVLIGIYLLGVWTHVGCCAMGGPASVIGGVVVPVVLLISLPFLVRDLIRPHTRVQAVVALVLLIPSVMVVHTIRL
jgi:hypothetical protein